MKVTYLNNNWWNTRFWLQTLIRKAQRRVAGAESNCDKIMPDGLLEMQWAMIEYSIQVTRGWKLEKFGGSVRVSGYTMEARLLTDIAPSNIWTDSAHYLLNYEPHFSGNWMKILNLSLTNWGAYSRTSMDRFDKLINFFGANLWRWFFSTKQERANPCQIVE